MVEDIFLDPSKLASVLDDYHPRPTQIEAANLINNSFNNYSNIVIEAPTGSGKTMAYLVPTYAHGRRTIISTKTKQLMQQLFLKDIPVMQKLYGERSVATLKGRKNYFCPHRFQRWIYPNAILYEDVINWYSAQDEAVTELPVGLFDFAILDKISADSNQCLYSKCKYFTACPFYTAKNIANDATIVITNHHLLLTDIAMKAKEEHGTIFDPADHIIFDEAHSIADIYSLYSGVEVSTRRLVNMIGDFKEKLPFKKLSNLFTMQEKLVSLVPDSKVLYSEIEGDVHSFMTLCAELVSELGDSDVEGEFARWHSAYEVMNGGDEGLRIAEQRGRDLLLKFVPMQVGNDFIQGVKEAAISSVFISATLTTDGTFDFFLNETGLIHEFVTTASLPNVYQMDRQGLLLIPRLPEGHARAHNDEWHDEYMYHLIKDIEGSVLIICNSLRRMEAIIEYLNAKQSAKAVFSQYDGDWSTFTSMANIVLVGCATLREGLDLAGGDFRCVIIDKLPFEYPHDLYLSMKAKRVEIEQGNSFMHFNLPRAVLYFKQAVGRLIRHESDKGIWVVFDERILTKRYGKHFLDVLDSVEVTNSYKRALEFVNSY